MTPKFHHVYQFRIILENVTPSVWRRIHVPETYTFWDFHVAIQDAMGWTDSHLHQFETNNPRTKKKDFIGIPEDVYDGMPIDFETLAGWKLNIRDYFSEENCIMTYLYDFGDGWMHRIEYERVLFKQSKQKYPHCVEGERACPPEDCGGCWAYEKLLGILENPSHEEHKQVKLWMGKKFDPEKFDASRIRFGNPEIRWKNSMMGMT